MMHSVKCNYCEAIAKVNGQKKIEAFGKLHTHNNPLAGKSGLYINLDNHEDRITLKLDKPDLITHGNFNPNDKYLR
jgi:hypothetical protein